MAPWNGPNKTAELLVNMQQKHYNSVVEVSAQYTIVINKYTPPQHAYIVTSGKTLLD